MVDLRPATAADSDRLWELRRESVRAIDSGHYTDQQLDAWSRRGDMGDFPYDEPTQYLVAAEADDVVGFGGADARDGELMAAYVAPDAPPGTGTALVERMESALSARHDRLVLDASLNAVPFYRHFGYEREELVTHENNGVELEFLRMARRLD